jgi:hypothetical protein
MPVLFHLQASGRGGPMLFDKILELIPHGLQEARLFRFPVQKAASSGWTPKVFSLRMSCLLHFANELFSSDLLNELLLTFVVPECEADWALL